MVFDFSIPALVHITEKPIITEADIWQLFQEICQVQIIKHCMRAYW